VRRNPPERVEETAVEDSKRLAETRSAAMWETDHASQNLGMRIAAIGPGEALMEMEIRPEMANGHGMCHGGFIFALADSAFAFACNSRDQRMVASQGAISFLAPAQVGDVLTARAREVHLRGRGGIYDVSVMNQQNELIAEFRGHCRAIPGPAPG
jgi:acyl-CoA thioesterase